MTAAADIGVERQPATTKARRSNSAITALLVFFGGVLAASMIVNILMVSNVFWLMDIKNFKWTTDGEKTACAGAELKEPSVSQSRIVDFAATAAVNLNSFTYANFRPVLNNAMVQYLTVTGRQNYTNAVLASGLLTQVRSEFLEVTAVTRNIPNISEEGAKAGRQYWTVEVPVRLFYKSNIGASSEARVLVMTVVRVEPSEANPNGIAIDGITSFQDTSAERL
jgi:intracellular multiplication protein IcmL